MPVRPQNDTGMLAAAKKLRDLAAGGAAAAESATRLTRTWWRD
jgi:hypothetical protein